MVDRCYPDPKRPQVPAKITIPSKLSITLDREANIFHDKTTFEKYRSTNPDLQSIIKGKLEHKKINYTQEITIP